MDFIDWTQTELAQDQPRWQCLFITGVEPSESVLEN
jgi:hypothetical protein